MFWTADGKLGTATSDTMYTKPFITAMWSASFFMEIKMYSQRSIIKKVFSQRKKCKVKETQWELTEKILFQEICTSYESVKKRDWNATAYIRLLKLLKLEKNSITALELLKVLILKKGLRHFLTTFKVINAKKGLHHFLMTLKVFNI